MWRGSVVTIWSLHKTGVKNKQQIHENAKEMHFSNSTYDNVCTVIRQHDPNLWKLCIRTILVFYYLFKAQMYFDSYIKKEASAMSMCSITKEIKTKL